MRTDVIYRGDCERVLSNPANFPDESVDLVYADPPFFTNRTYEQIWRNPDGSPDEYEVRSFKDRWAGGVENFIAWIDPKIRECHRVLKPNGTMYLHCDHHANSYLRVLMDRVFGPSHFRNEIVWCYTGPGNHPKDFGRKHDTILRYTKGDEWTFNADAVRVPYNPSTLSRAQYAQAGYKVLKSDKTRWTQEGGKIPEDWWPEFSPVGRHKSELLGYPTQKPEALLERMVLASSNPGGLVLDPFCGCGTAIAVAQKSGRHWVGIDISPNACGVMKERMDRTLAVTGGVAQIVGMPKTLADLHRLKMTPFEFQTWAIEALHGIASSKMRGDMGLDGRTYHGDAGIQIKQEERVGRNHLDNFKSALDREQKRTGIFVAFSFGRGFIEEAKRLGNLPNGQRYDIKMRKAEDLLEEQ